MIRERFSEVKDPALKEVHQSLFLHLLQIYFPCKDSYRSRHNFFHHNMESREGKSHSLRQPDRANNLSEVFPLDSWDQKAPEFFLQEDCQMHWSWIVRYDNIATRNYPEQCIEVCLANHINDINLFTSKIITDPKVWLCSRRKTWYPFSRRRHDIST